MATKKTTSKKSAAKSSSAKLMTKKNDSVKMALIVVLAALVGGFSVWLANAGTATVKSLADCKMTVSANVKADGTIVPTTNDSKTLAATNAYRDCVDSSAEALVYRYYVGLAGRKPEKLHVPLRRTDGIVFWRNALTEKKETPARVAERMLCTNELRKLGLVGADKDASRCTVAPDKSGDVKLYVQKNNQDFVDWVYLKMLGKDASKKSGVYLKDPEGRAYWKKKLDSKKLTRAEVVASIAQSSEAKRVNSANFVKYILEAELLQLGVNPANK
jgi:hypothetical protein